MRKRLVKCFKDACNALTDARLEALEQEKELSLDECEEIMADHLIANGVTIHKWIPVTERLPEKEGTYIVHGNLGGVFGLFYDDMLSDSFKQMCTHWMPLPEPPKGE